MAERKPRNGFEQSFMDMCPGYLYEPFRLPYKKVRNSHYTPDFVDEERKIIVETKGRIRELEDLRAYQDIREQYPEYRFIFVLQSPTSKAYRQAKKITLAEWLTKEGFEWYTMETFPEELKDNKNE